MQDIKVMIVGSSPFSVKQVENKLLKNGIQIVAKAFNKSEMLEQFNLKKPNLITMDLAMPELDGFDSVELLRSINTDFKSIVIGPLKNDLELIHEVKRYKIDAYIQRPVKEEELINTVKNIYS